jgi:hypothetical protein
MALPLGPLTLETESGMGWDEAMQENDPDLRSSGAFAPGWLGWVYSVHGFLMPKKDWHGLRGWIWGGYDQFREGWTAWSGTASLQKEVEMGTSVFWVSYENHDLDSESEMETTLIGFSAWGVEAEWNMPPNPAIVGIRIGLHTQTDDWNIGVPIWEELNFPLPPDRRRAEIGLSLKVPVGNNWNWDGSVRSGYEWSGKDGGVLVGARLRLRYKGMIR